MAGIYSQGGSAGHRYAGWLETVEAKNFQFGGKVFNGSPSAIYVGSNLVWVGRWLTVAAAQAILGAFGQTDGMAVIKATNAYLTQLAASDRDKATALAGFINEDPMMVCSLGLQPQLTVLPAMPIRGLFQSTTGYFESQYYPNGSDKFEVVFKYKEFVANYNGTIYGAYNLSNGDNNCRYYTFNSGSRSTSRFSYKSGYDDSVSAPSYNVRHIAIDDAGTLYIDGTLKKSNTPQTFTCAGPFRLFTTGWTHVPERSAGVSIYHGKINDGATLWMVPLKRNGNFEMVDLVSGNLATRVGTFTEFYELPDGTPWTPSP